MLSFQVLVLGSLFVSFRPSLIRFPQLFLRCFPYALALGIFRFSSAFFRPLPFRLRLLSPLFFLSALPGFTSQRFSRCALPLSLLRFPLSLRPDLSCFPSRFSYSALCSFPFALPRFAPTAVPRVLAFRFRLRPFPFPSGFFRPLRFRF